MGGVSVYHNSGEDDLEQLEEFMLMEAMRLSLQESETAKGRVETTDETPISVSSPALPPESVAAPAPAHTAAVSLCDTRETDPPLPVLDLDSADDDVLLSYALSLSQMQDQDSPATATITSSASIRFITPPHIPPADPGSVEIVHVSDSKMGADIGAPVSLSAPPRISFSQSQSSKESVTLKGPAAGSGDAHPKQVGLSEMSFLPQARGTPSESEVNARSVPDSVSPCTSPGLVKKSSSARLLEMIDAALSSPVGEFTGKLSMSDSENDEEVGNRKQSNGDEAGSLHGGGDFFAAESVESALSSSGRCEVEAEESKRKTPTE
ncbi:unnamed protein product [Symbiodinium microadriaticum]|nr:unnamed protein product [Symbiodinium microadriaticum]